MNIQITPRRLRGTVTPPPSKSMAHRAALAQMLSGGVITVPDLNQDIEATKRCAEIPRTGGNAVLDCGESGSTLRFLIPIALALAGGGVFTGHGRLMDRPQRPYFDIFREKGIFYEQTGRILTVRGRLTPGEYRLPGDVSSQFVTGLLYALPLLDGDSTLVLTTPLESAPYVAMTLQVLEQSGVSVENRGYQVFFIPGGQRYHAGELPIEADWSQAAFWYAADFLGNAVEIRGLNPDSAQGDRIVESLSRRLRAGGTVEIDLSGCPDLLPPLAVMAAGREGITRFLHAGRLRLKESDRLESVSRMLRAFGIQTEEGPDFLTVQGGLSAAGTDTEIFVDGSNDHRIVMAAAVAATACTGPVMISGADAVRKSYPGFFDEYRRLGGEFYVL